MRSKSKDSRHQVLNSFVLYHCPLNNSKRANKTTPKRFFEKRASSPLQHTAVVSPIFAFRPRAAFSSWRQGGRLRQEIHRRRCWRLRRQRRRNEFGKGSYIGSAGRNSPRQPEDAGDAVRRRKFPPMADGRGWRQLSRRRSAPWSADAKKG